MLIYKEPLPCPGARIIKLSFTDVEEAKRNILKVDTQSGYPCTWYAVMDQEDKEFVILSIGTGHNVPEMKLEEYIGTALVFNDAFVWHYFITDMKTLNERGVHMEVTSDEED